MTLAKGHSSGKQILLAIGIAIITSIFVSYLMLNLDFLSSGWMFFIQLIIGVILLIVAFGLSVEAVSLGLMGGGVLIILSGTWSYWYNLSDILRTLILGVALIAIIVFAYRKLK